MADLASFVEPYVAALRAQGLAAGTVALRMGQLRQAVAHLRRRGVLRAADLRAEDLDRLLLQLRDRGLARSTVKSIRDALAGFGRWLAEHGRVLRDPADGLSVGSAWDEELPPPPLSEEQVRALLDTVSRHDAIGLRNAAHLELLYSCGLRLSESLALDVGDLDRDRRMLLVRGKGGHERLVPLQPGTLAAVADYLVLRRILLRGPDHGALFLSRRGNRLDGHTLWRWLKGHARRVLGPEVHVHPHLLRHSIVVHLLRKGVDIRHLQEFLGHADIDTTKGYLRLVPEHLRADYDKAMPPLAEVGERG